MSIEGIASIGSDIPLAHPVLSPDPASPPTGTATASTPGDSTSATHSSDGSITTTVVDASGATVAVTTTRPDHPLSVEA